ncbi:MAG: Dyp-type peroxidase, partial [Chthoniobacterales bacterium]
MSEVDYNDVQGLLRFGFGKMKEATYALLRVRNAAAARAWLRSAPVTSAEAMAPPPSTALQVAFTAAGLTSLG